MRSQRVLLIFLLACFTGTSVFAQSESLKVVANSLGFFRQKNDINYLARAKKSIDSLIRTRKDSNNIEKSIYKGLVYASILQMDSTNKLNMPGDFYAKTVDFVDNHLAIHRKIDEYPDEYAFIKQCMGNASIRVGFKYMDKLDYVNAEKSFEKAHRYIPAYMPVNAYLAYANNKLGKLRVASLYYNRLMDSDSLKAEHIQSAVNINIAIGDTAKALQILQKGKQVLPGDKYLLMDEANIYNNKHDYKALKPLLPALLQEYGNNAEVVFVAANCYDQLNEYDRAEELYLQAVEQNSAIFDPVFNLGLLYCKKATNDKAEDQRLKDVYYATRWLEKANEILPSDTKSLDLLKKIYEQTGNQRQFDKVNRKLNQLNNKVIYEN